MLMGYRVGPEDPAESVVINGFAVPVLGLPHQVVRDLWDDSPPRLAEISVKWSPNSKQDDAGEDTAVAIERYDDIQVYLRRATTDDRKWRMLFAYWKD